MATASKIEISPKTTSNKIILEDADWAMYQVYQELVEAMKELSRRLASIR
jgi:site-specific DNA-adenine methylase